MDALHFQRHKISAPSNQNHVNRYEPDNTYTRHHNPSRASDQVILLPSVPCVLAEVQDGSEQVDYFDGVFNYLNKMLMEEDDLANKPCMYIDSLALQAAEKSFYDALVNSHRLPDNDQKTNLESTLHVFAPSQVCQTSSGSSSSNPNDSSDSKIASASSNFSCSETEFAPNWRTSLGKFSLSCTSSSNTSRNRNISSLSLSANAPMAFAKQTAISSVPKASCGEKRNVNFEDGSDDVNMKEWARTKQPAFTLEDSEQSEVYDSVLLCKHISRLWLSLPEKLTTGYVQRERKNDRRGHGKRMAANKNAGEIVDLTELLIQCAEMTANNNRTVTDQILKKVIKYSSPYGNSSERMAHYFARAIEARLAGTGTLLYQAFSSTRVSATQILTSYKAYIKACPFHRMSNIFANKSIAKLSNGRNKIHIIDFGILYGFQWPCIIQGLSLRPGGPPKLKITGIDLPQPGHCPAERVEETGRRLAEYAKRFNVPFEYYSIAKNWENIRNEDLKIDSEEMLVVNSIYRMRNVLDETVVERRPRDKVLKFIYNLNPELFVHGILNGNYNATYFLTRFREALFHFTTLFDMFESTSGSEDKERLLFEQEVLGRDIMNVVACEGQSRVERPESYKKWGVRNAKAGFRQLPLFPQFVKEVRAKVKRNYHKDFEVHEDVNWMLQGWKGRVLYALSLWTPERPNHK